MWRKILCIIPLLLSTNAIKVPVDNNNEPSTETSRVNYEDTAQGSPSYYITDDTNLDSYLIPPDPHKPDEELSGVLITPATYLLPPSPENQQDFYNPTKPGEQSDWYPIAQNQEQTEIIKSLPIVIANDNKPQVKFIKNTRAGKGLTREGIIINVPSTHLEPPSLSASNDYLLPPPSEDLELPAEEIDHPRKPSHSNNYHQSYQEIRKKIPTDNVPLHYHPALPEPSLALHLTPPKEHFAKQKTPTKLYPKKYSLKFKPVPIPIAQFADETEEVPRAKPLKMFKPISSGDNDYTEPIDEKQVYRYQNDKQKPKLKGEYEALQEQQEAVDASEESFTKLAPSEQEASETNHRYPGRDDYSAPVRQTPRPAPALQRSAHTAAPAPGERTEFRMHGMKGPHSYQFGYDTGKGKNRQFRFEERDNDGVVHGHYGYMDKSGKLRVVNYSAHPELGFHAEAPVERE